MTNNNPEEIIADETLDRAKSTYNYKGANYDLTDEQKATFKPFTVETVNDVIMLMALSMKENNNDLLVEIHDRLMVSDLSLAYDVLIVMIKLGDNNKMYMDFVQYTVQSKIDSKGVYRRCLGAIGFYSFNDKQGYNNPILGLEYVHNFGNGLGGIMINETTDLQANRHDYKNNFREMYRTYIANKYSDLIEQVSKV